MMFRLKKIAPYLAMASGVVGCVYTILFPVGIVSAYLAGLSMFAFEAAR